MNLKLLKDSFQLIKYVLAAILIFFFSLLGYIDYKEKPFLDSVVELSK